VIYRYPLVDTKELIVHHTNNHSAVGFNVLYLSLGPMIAQELVCVCRLVYLSSCIWPEWIMAAAGFAQELVVICGLGISEHWRARKISLWINMEMEMMSRKRLLSIQKS
jgi:hypothetical protein